VRPSGLRQHFFKQRRINVRWINLWWFDLGRIKLRWVFPWRLNEWRIKHRQLDIKRLFVFFRRFVFERWIVILRRIKLKQLVLRWIIGSFDIVDLWRIDIIVFRRINRLNKFRRRVNGFVIWWHVFDLVGRRIKHIEHLGRDQLNRRR
jgi:hypothetical protein